ncbi:MAG: hypothetical protein AB2536_19165 [Candidatus Thiodiazotropha endolucinida]
MENHIRTSTNIKNDRITPGAAKTALSILEHKIYQMDVAISLLSDLESNKFNEIGDGIGRYTYRVIAIEYANNARCDLFEALDEVQKFIGNTEMSLT